MIATLPVSLDTGSWRCTDSLSPSVHREVMRIMSLYGHKWDARVGDIATLAPFALVVPQSDWRELKKLAENLSNELKAIEEALIERPDLWPELGLPPVMLEVLRGREPLAPSAARVVRYDFHPTSDGWKISEVNSDVPGGFNEASGFTELMAQHFREFHAPENPLATLANALLTTITDDGARSMALLTAPGYNEDIQVVSGVGVALRSYGIKTHFMSPANCTGKTAGLICVRRRVCAPSDRSIASIRANGSPSCLSKGGSRCFAVG